MEATKYVPQYMTSWQRRIAKGRLLASDGRLTPLGRAVAQSITIMATMRRDIECRQETK